MTEINFMSHMNRAAAPLRTLMLVLFLLLAAGTGLARNELSLTVSLDEASRAGAASVDPIVSFPGQRNLPVFLSDPKDWLNLGELNFNIWWPENGPTNAQVMVYVKDGDFFWYQNLLPGYLAPGRENTLKADFSPAAAASWKPQGHRGTWHLLSLANPRQVGISIFSDTAFIGTCKVSRVTGSTRQEGGAPSIRNMRANTGEVPVYRKFELSFELQDRYSDPYDPGQIMVSASIEDPAGATNTVEGYYSENFYKETDPTGEHLIPQGKPLWHLRYTPSRRGKHTFTVKARDRFGETTWGPSSFEATAPTGHGFIRVARKDPRYFEFTDGTFFFPLGHNTRSPFDTRMDELFPWTQRWQNGPGVYPGYFRKMNAAGENICEIWTAAWSLGLEWTTERPGYRGLGSYNMMNAWMLDQIVDEAEKNNIHINLVIHNHGKFGTHLDHEWEFNPFNVINGGYLRSPDEFFSNRRAMEDFCKLMRYMIARYGYSPRIFAWQLWSELDLTGTAGDRYRRPEITSWHETAARRIAEMDPYDHIISTHVSGDYKRQNNDVLNLPGITASAVDAYHYSTDSLAIVPLLRATADHDKVFRKPILVSEFGGSHMAQGVKHLEEALHAGLWSSTAMELSGAPMLWWWQVIDEENFYPEFAAVSRFMAGEDKRDVTLLPATPELSTQDSQLQLGIQCLKNSNRAIGWIHRRTEFDRVTPAISNVVMKLTGMKDGTYNVEFWNTATGLPVVTNSLTTQDGTLNCQVPAFVRDTAFKVKE